MDEPTPDSAETRGLLEEARKGDRLGFDRLLARHRPDLLQFVALRMDRKLRGRLDPSDVVQDAHLEVYRRLGDFLDRRPMPFHIWLRKTAYERLLMARRQHVEAAQRAVRRYEISHDLRPIPGSNSPFRPHCFRLSAHLRNAGRYFAAGVASVDTGGEVTLALESRV